MLVPVLTKLSYLKMDDMLRCVKFGKKHRKLAYSKTGNMLIWQKADFGKKHTSKV